MLKWKTAWRNAIVVEENDPEKFRMCYLCEKLMFKVSRWESKAEHIGGWDVDFIDGDETNLVENNVVAVHHECLLKHLGEDNLQKFQEMKQRTWTEADLANSWG